MPRCANGHECWWRGYTIDYVTNGVRANLSIDLDDAFIPTLIRYYTGNDRMIAPYVHPQLRAVLERFAKTITA